MFIQAIRSEWIKLRTTQGFWITSVLVLAFGLISAALAGWMISKGADLVPLDPGTPKPSPAGALIGELDSTMKPLGYFIMIGQAVVFVCSEFRHRLLATSVLGTPNRALVAGAKWVVYGLASMAITAVTLLVSTVVACLAAGAPGAAGTIFGDPAFWGLLGRMMVGGLLFVTMAMGFAWLTHSTTFPVMVLILWASFEGAFQLIPKIGPIEVGKVVSKFGPMGHLDAFIHGQPHGGFPLGFVGAGLWFALWAFGFLALGVARLRREDVKV